MKVRCIWCGVLALAVVALMARQNLVQAGPQAGGHWPPVGWNSGSSSSSSSAVPFVPTAVPAAAARLNIRLPQNAHLWVEGKEMAQTGTEFQLVSPALDPGYNYTYHLKVQWNERGADITRTRAVPVR